jgi:hypothetical protein
MSATVQPLPDGIPRRRHCSRGTLQREDDGDQDAALAKVRAAGLEGNAYTVK